MKSRYDVIVIGGGHAGTEAAWAAASALAASRDHPGAMLRPVRAKHAQVSDDSEHGSPCGMSRGTPDSCGQDASATPGSGVSTVALITMDPSKIGAMSCNPAIGGLAKGQIVREIDALGGLMGRAIDATGIMFKMLNLSKGPAVRGPRAQADKYAYASEIQRLISTRSNIDVIAGKVDDIVVENGQVVGVKLPAGSGVVRVLPDRIERHLKGQEQSLPLYSDTPDESDRGDESVLLQSNAIVLTTGTFMRALMHTGEKKTEGGRVDEGSAVGISATLKNLGFELGRLKTGTPPRIARESIDWDELPKQFGDEEPVRFSDYPMEIEGEIRTGKMPMPLFPRLPQIQCRITETNAEIHEVIRANLHRAPMYSGQIEADAGPRYCPSIEDKVVRFSERDSHHVFLEPESLHTNEVYCNGISTSLPPDVQDIVVRGMAGCANAKILKYGYAVEYDMVWPHQIDSTCMTKVVGGLFLAGQINGTSGYEEAGGQGLIAGLNAARLSNDQELIRLGRDAAYIGVMLDDLVTKTPREPYRMFTSRAEHRLLLRADNADVRLTPLAREYGLIDDHHWQSFEKRRDQLKELAQSFDDIAIAGKTLREIARRPTTTLDEVCTHLNGALPKPLDAESRLLVQRVMTDARYEGYIARQHAEIKRQTSADNQQIPEWFEPWAVTGLRSEAAEALQKFKPTTMGMASRLPGVSPADLTLLAVTLKRKRNEVD